MGSAIVRSIVESLLKNADENEVGFAWRSGGELSPRGRGNKWRGTAHGTGGVVGFLAMAHASGIRDPSIARLLGGAVERLIHDLRVEGSAKIIYSWCWGDAALAAVLLLASRCASNPVWEAEALTLARSCASRVNEHQCRDACLCHGTAGQAHVFNRLFQASRDPGFADAARFFVRETLRARREGRGIAGYEFVFDLPEYKSTWAPTPGILSGLAGMALALEATIASIEPTWDQFMVLSVPTQVSKCQE